MPDRHVHIGIVPSQPVASATRRRWDDPKLRPKPACAHDSLSGDEGPVQALPGGGHPVRWRCDGCGAISYDDAALGQLRELVAGYEKAADLEMLHAHRALDTLQGPVPYDVGAP